MREALKAIERLTIPAGCACSLTVVDNASTDGTAELIKLFDLGNMPLHYVREPQPSLAYAYNAGTASTDRDILL